MTASHTLQVIHPRGDAPLSPAQKRFNTLVRQIAKARDAVAAWQAALPVFRAAHAEQIPPLEAELTRAQRARVFVLATQLGRTGWTRTDRDTMRELLCDEAYALLVETPDDAPLAALFAEHTGTDFATEERARIAAMKHFTEAMTGLDLGDADGLTSDDALLERLLQTMQADAERRAAQAEAVAVADTPPPEEPQPAHASRRSQARQRRDAQARAATEAATQSVREVYRKLASALHPDRETDPSQRAIKTELMQQANQAYAANDLLALLELQLRIEQIDPQTLATVGAAKLKLYNTVLAEQLATLKAGLHDIHHAVRMEFDLTPHQPLHPDKLGALLATIAGELRSALIVVTHETTLLGDKATAKRWLARERKRMREMDDDMESFF